jgi:signal transduction histidine kinase
MTTWVRDRERLAEGFKVSRHSSASKEGPGRDQRRAEELLRAASADLLAPLHTIGVLTDICREVEEQSASTLETILNRVGMLAREATALVEDVLALEQLRLGDHPETDDDPPAAAAALDVDVDVEEAMGDAILLQQEALERAHCPIIVHRAPPEQGRLRGPWKRDALVRMFSHLFRNARWRATATPAIVDLSMTPGWLRVLFSDGGELKESAAVGDSFRRLAGVQRGNGLGLWILHRTVVDLGGEMEIQTDAAGPRFDIRLPLRRGGIGSRNASGVRCASVG